MPNSFWSNTIWYILLLISSIITVIVTLIKAKNRKFTIGFTLATLGFVYLLEAVGVLFLKAYQYYPKLSADVFQDSVLGNYFSQVSISATSMFTIVFNLSYVWYFLLAFIYYLIEELFIKLGIYQHNWYKSIYTLIGFAPLLWLIKKWNYKLISSSKRVVYYITLFLGTFSISANSLTLPLKLLKIQIFKLNIFGQLSKNHTASGIIYAFIVITIMIVLYKSRNQVIKVIAFIIMYSLQFILYKFNIIYIKPGYFVIVTLIDLCGIYFWVAVL